MVLEDEPDPSGFGGEPRARRRVLENRSVDLDPTLVQRHESGEDAKQGRLAGAIRSEHGDGHVGVDREVALEMQASELGADPRLQRHRSAPSHRSRSTTSTSTEIARRRSDNVIAMPICPDPSNEV